MPNSGAIRAGKAFVELALSGWEGFKSGLDKARSMVETFGKKTQAIGLKTAGIGAGILTPITAVFASSANRAADIKLLSDKFDTSAETISAWAYAFERGGLSLDEFGGTLDSFRAKLFAAADGSDDDFRRIGLNALSLEKMSKTEAFQTVIDRINNLGKATDRQEIGLRFFGSAWDKLGTTVLKSSESFNALKQEAKDVGAVITNEQAAQGQKSIQAFTQAWQALKYGIMEVGMQLLPQADNIQRVVKEFSNGIQVVRKFIQNNSQLVIAVVAVGAGLVAAGVALIAFGKLLIFGTAAFSALATIVGTITSVIASPFVLAFVAASAAIAFMLSQLNLLGKTFDRIKGFLGVLGEKVTSVFGNLKNTIVDVFGQISESWGLIVDLITAGDIEGAFQVLKVTVISIWSSLTYRMLEIWEDFKEKFAEAVEDTQSVISKSLIGLQALGVYLTGGKQEAQKFVKEQDEQLKQMDREEYARRWKAKNDRLNAARIQMEDAKQEMDKIKEAKKEQLNQPKVNAANADPFANMAESMMRALAIKFEKFELPNAQQLYKTSKGTSGSFNVQQQLAYGDGIAERQLKTQQQMLREQEQIKEAVQGLGLTWR